MSEAILKRDNEMIRDLYIVDGHIPLINQIQPGEMLELQMCQAMAVMDKIDTAPSRIDLRKDFNPICELTEKLAKSPATFYDELKRYSAPYKAIVHELSSRINNQPKNSTERLHYETIMRSLGWEPDNTSTTTPERPIDMPVAKPIDSGKQVVEELAVPGWRLKRTIASVSGVAAIFGVATEGMAFASPSTPSPNASETSVHAPATPGTAKSGNTANRPQPIAEGSSSVIVMPKAPDSKTSKTEQVTVVVGSQDGAETSAAPEITVTNTPNVPTESNQPITVGDEKTSGDIPVKPPTHEELLPKVPAINVTNLYAPPVTAELIPVAPMPVAPPEATPVSGNTSANSLTAPGSAAPAPAKIAPITVEPSHDIEKTRRTFEADPLSVAQSNAAIAGFLAQQGAPNSQVFDTVAKSLDNSGHVAVQAPEFQSAVLTFVDTIDHSSTANRELPTAQDSLKDQTLLLAQKEAYYPGTVTQDEVNSLLVQLSPARLNYAKLQFKHTYSKTLSGDMAQGFTPDQLNTINTLLSIADASSATVQAVQSIIEAFTPPPAPHKKPAAHKPKHAAPSGPNTAHKAPTHSRELIHLNDRQLAARTAESMMRQGGLNARRGQLIKYFLHNTDWSLNAIYGIVGNGQHESKGLYPMMAQATQTEVPAGEMLAQGYSGGWGLWQSDPPGKVIKFLIDSGKDPNNPLNQAWWIIQVMNSNPSYYKLHELNAAHSPEEAAVIFEQGFERAGVPALAPRQQYARDVANVFNGIFTRVKSEKSRQIRQYHHDLEVQRQAEARKRAEADARQKAGEALHAMQQKISDTVVSFLNPDQYNNAMDTLLNRVPGYAKLSGGEDCALSVGTAVLMAGIDPSFPFASTINQYTYMKNSSHWTPVQNLHNESDLRPGDIFSIGREQGSGDQGHTFIYIGKGQIVSASLDDHGPRLEQVYFTDDRNPGGDVDIFRYVG